MKIVGNEFRTKVWNEIKKIPRGKTVSYKYITKKIGKPFTCKAVANACAENPLPIIISYYRVIKQNGETGRNFKKKIQLKKKTFKTRIYLTGS